ncbi:MAG: YitT family protein [Anaerofustis sp.]
MKRKLSEGSIMEQIKRLLLSLLFYCISAFGVSLSIQVDIGVSAYNAMNVALSAASGLKVGTVTTLFNFAFLLAYMILTKFRHPFKYVLQAVFVLIFGSLINFYVYTILQNFAVHTYLMKLLVLSVGTVISGLSVGMIIHYNVITFPIESFCVEMESCTSRKFAFFRYGVDLFSAAVSLGVSLAFGLPLYVREGTAVSMILLTASMNISKEKMAKRLAIKEQNTLS